MSRLHEFQLFSGLRHETIDQLTRDGLIQLDGKDLVIPDVANLQKRAHAFVL